MIATVTLNPSLDEWVHLGAFRVGALNRAKTFGRYPGGNGINVSRVLHELGARTIALALAGGEDGKSLKDLLTGHAIPHRFVTVPGSTRNNYHIQTGSPKALTQINCPGPRVSATSLRRIAQALRRARPRPACVVFSGSLPPGAPLSTYQRMIQTVRRLGTLTVLDTSGPALRQGLLARPWLIKPNRHEAEELLGARLQRLAHVAQAARWLTTKGPSFVIISLGYDGAVLATEWNEEILWAKPPTVTVDSPVGAGDSLVAGFVLGWLRTQSLSEALQLGVACGAACAMTPGTELCHRADVRRMRQALDLNCGD